MKANSKILALAVGAAISLLALAGCKNNAGGNAETVPNGFVKRHVKFETGWWFTVIPADDEYKEARMAQFFDPSRECTIMFQAPFTKVTEQDKAPIERYKSKGDDCGGDFPTDEHDMVLIESSVKFYKAKGGYYDVQDKFESGWWKVDITGEDTTGEEGTYTSWYKFDASKDRVEWRGPHEGKIYSDTEKDDYTNWRQWGEISAVYFVNFGTIPEFTKVDESDVPAVSEP